MSAVQVRAVGEMLRTARRFCSSPGKQIPTVGRGRGRLHEMLVNCSHNYSQHVLPNSCIAEQVDPSRVSLPVCAGVCEPVSVLCPERARVVRDLNKIVMPVSMQPELLPKPCHMITASDELALNKRLLDSNMAILIEESFVPKDAKGNLILEDGSVCPILRVDNG